MKAIHWLIIFCLIPGALAQQAPWGRPDIPISSHDRVYAADQTSNTVSVIDPFTHEGCSPSSGYSPDERVQSVKMFCDRAGTAALFMVSIWYPLTPKNDDTGRK